MVKEGRCIPTVIGCYLRKQKAACAIAPGDQPVPSNVNMGRPVGRLAVKRDRDGKDRYFKIKGVQFILFYARERGSSSAAATAAFSIASPSGMTG